MPASTPPGATDDTSQTSHASRLLHNNTGRPKGSRRTARARKPSGNSSHKGRTSGNRKPYGRDENKTDENKTGESRAGEQTAGEKKESEDSFGVIVKILKNRFDMDTIAEQHCCQAHCASQSYRQPPLFLPDTKPRLITAGKHCLADIFYRNMEIYITTRMLYE